MKRLGLIITTSVVALAAPSAADAGPQAANETASCVATITSFEATQLPPGSVGAEVSEFATTNSPGFVGGLVSGLAKDHGSPENCAGDS